MNNIILISPKNESSGACVSIKNLSNILKKSNFKTTMVSPKGNFLINQYLIYETLFNTRSILKNIFILRRLTFENDLLVFNTILLSIYYIFLPKRNKILYLHEQDLKPTFLYKIVNFYINIFDIKTAVVNPKMLKLYKNSFLLPNSFNYTNAKKNGYKSKKKKIGNQVIMIARCTFKKGIKSFVKIVKANQDYKFVLFTSWDGSDLRCQKYIRDIKIKNLHVELDQSKKSDLLTSASYLLSMSHYNETFGYVLCEAIQHEVIPISVKNDGSDYCLNFNDQLIFERSEIETNFSSIISKISNNKKSLIDDLKKYHAKTFSDKKILKIFKDELINKKYF